MDGYCDAWKCLTVLSGRTVDLEWEGYGSQIMSRCCVRGQGTMVFLLLGNTVHYGLYAVGYSALQDSTETMDMNKDCIHLSLVSHRISAISNDLICDQSKSSLSSFTRDGQDLQHTCYTRVALFQWKYIKIVFNRWHGVQTLKKKNIILWRYTVLFGRP